MGRGLKRGEFQIKTRRLSSAISPIGWRRGRKHRQPVFLRQSPPLRFRKTAQKSPEVRIRPPESASVRVIWRKEGGRMGSGAIFRRATPNPLISSKKARKTGFRRFLPVFAGFTRGGWGTFGGSWKALFGRGNSYENAGLVKSCMLTSH